jgi:acetoin utilization protein AcuC
MPPNSDDLAYERASEKIVPSLFEMFRPEAVVAQMRADAHYADPLTNMKMNRNEI